VDASQAKRPTVAGALTRLIGGGSDRCSVKPSSPLSAGSSSPVIRERPAEKKNGFETAEDVLADAFGFANVDTYREASSRKAASCAGESAHGSRATGFATPELSRPMPPPLAPLATEGTLERLDEWEEEMLSREADAVDEDVLAFVHLRLEQQAEPWPAHLAAPASTAEVVDPDGRWSATACGVEIRLCTDEPTKGMGAYATRPLRAGTVVGVYWGERLTMREHALRHGWRSGVAVEAPSRADKRALAARTSRLGALSVGAPMGPGGRGEANGSAYCFSLFSDDVKAAIGSTLIPQLYAYIDGEDPDRSSWCRYINHAKPSTEVCNLVSKVDGLRGLVWFEASRDIAKGDELGFDYGENYRWDHAK